MQSLADLFNPPRERWDYVLTDPDAKLTPSQIEDLKHAQEAFLKQPVAYLTGRLRLPANHPLNKKGPVVKMRPSSSVENDLLCELRERITITENGKGMTITKLEALVKTIVNQAILGDSRVFSLLEKFFQEYNWDQEDASVIRLTKDRLIGAKSAVALEILFREPFIPYSPLRPEHV
jgi:hypothetical protein